MHHTKQTNTGFTLIEVLFIAPMAMLVLATFVYLLSTLIGDVLVQRERNIISYSLQDATDKIEDDIKLSVNFLATTGILTSPQGANNSTLPFNSDTALVLSQLGTTARPGIDERKLSFSQQKDKDLCGTSLQNRNEIIKVTVVYFLDNVSPKNLWRRTIVPKEPLPCAGLTPWQQNSCNPSRLTAECKVSDIKIATDISTMTFSYYNSPGSAATSTASSATTISTVTLTSSKTVAGRDISVANAISAKKLNY